MTVFKLSQNAEEELKKLEEEFQVIEEKNRELKLAIAKKKQELELQKPVHIHYVLANKYPIRVGIKLSSYRDDIVQTIKEYKSWSFSYAAQTNIVSFDDYLEFALLAFPNVTEETDPKIEAAFQEEHNPTKYIVEYSPKGFYVTVKKGNRSQLLYAIDTAAHTADHNQFLIHLSEGWRLGKFITQFKNEEIFCDDKAWNIINEQVNRRSRLQEIKNLNNIEYTVENLKGNLKSFQNVTCEFTEIAERCINANEMGLGKSVTSLAVSIKNNYRTLIICPASLMLNWDEEVKKWTDYIPYIIQSTAPQDHHFVEMLVTKPMFTIINYESLSRFIEVKDDNGLITEENLWITLLNGAKFDRIVVDEAHYIKNLDSARSKAVRKLNAPKLTLLTGTPVMNRPAELFPMLNMIDPITFRSYAGFMKTYSDGGNGVQNSNILRELLSPIMFRKTKKDVMTELEPIMRSNHYYELNSSDRERYKKVLNGIYESLRSNQKYNVTNILVEFMRCKQICSQAAIPHAIAHIEDVLAENEGNEYNKIIVFSQFKDTVYEIANSFGDKAVTITGDQSQTNRMESVAKFQNNDSIKIAICTTQVASEGLNMTAAGSVLFIDLMWTPAKHQQAEGRAYGRLADAHTINSIYMIAKNTIMEYINRTLQEKLRMINEVVEGEDSVSSEMIQGILSNLG